MELHKMNFETKLRNLIKSKYAKNTDFYKDFLIKLMSILKRNVSNGWQEIISPLLNLQLKYVIFSAVI